MPDDSKVKVGVTAIGTAVLVGALSFMGGRQQLKAEIVTALGYDPTIVAIQATIPDSGPLPVPPPPIAKALAATLRAYTGEHDVPGKGAQSAAAKR